MPITTTAQADEALRTIGRINRDFKEEEILLNDAIERMKQAIDQKLQPKLDEKRRLEAELEQFVQDEFATWEQRSITLSYGRLGYRDFRSEVVLMKGHTQESAAKLLLKKRYNQCVQVKYKIIKNAVSALKLSEDKLRSLGLRIRQKKNQFFYEINEQKISEEK